MPAVIARSEATKQSRGTGQNVSPIPLDCFAPLAMTAFPRTKEEPAAFAAGSIAGRMFSIRNAPGSPAAEER
ncbi:hypothetical protein FQV39_08485 [Bosea sp. F3-2]|nr:hypothetical protein FQV39_08485 [Bosea sp. F3-2]